MAGTINSLGIGSGVLTADVIDKLKENEKDLTIKPIEKKLELQKQKTQSLDLLKSLLTTFRGSVKALDDDALYQSRTVSGNNDGVEVSALDGVAVQNFSISDTKLAKSNVLQSSSFSSRTSSVASSNGTMSISIDGSSYDIDYTDTMTLEELATAINDKAGDKVKASILQVGDNDYRLIFTSKETGTAQNITITDSSNGGLDTGLYKQTDSITSGAFDNTTDTIASASGNLTLTIDGQNYTINYDDTTTLDDLKDSINNAVGSNVASITQDTNGKYLLDIASTINGEDTSLKLVDNSGNLDSKITSYTEHNALTQIQEASDASFKFNGITITRSSNSIDDLITGVTIKLKNDNAQANIGISQDASKIADEMESFVENYNSLMSEINKMTLADKEEGKVGLFNGDNSIRSIGREITKLVTSFDDSGMSLAQFGINLSQDGTMSFDRTAFDKKFQEDPQAAEMFLSGGSSVDRNGNIVTHDGIFTKLSDTVTGYTSFNGMLDTLISSNKNTTKNLEEQYEKSLSFLNRRYDTMTQQFIEYDAIISKLNNQFAALQQQIEMAINAKN